MAKKIDPKAKAKRQKIYAGVGGVILLAVLAFQVPRTLKMMHPATRAPRARRPRRRPARRRRRSARPRWAAATPPSTAAAAPGGDGITDPDAVPPPQSGQLLAFGLFRSKDPFVQQLKLERATGADGRRAALAGTTGAERARRPEAPAASGAGGGSKPASLGLDPGRAGDADDQR